MKRTNFLVFGLIPAFLWLCAGVHFLSVADPAATGRAATVFAAPVSRVSPVEACFSAARHHASLFEAPQGISVPPATRVVSGARTGDQIHLPGYTPLLHHYLFKGPTPWGSLPRSFPITVRAVQRYVYGMRKILI